MIDRISSTVYLLHSVPSEAESTTTSDEPHVESVKPSDTNQAPKEVPHEASPAESLSFVPEASAPAPADSAPLSEEPPAPKASEGPTGTRNILAHKVKKQKVL